MEIEIIKVKDAAKELYESYLACNEEDRKDYMEFIDNPNEDTLGVLGLPVLCMLYVTDFGEATPYTTKVKFEYLANKLKHMITPPKRNRRRKYTEEEAKERAKEYQHKYYLAHKEKINNYNNERYWQMKNAKKDKSVDTQEDNT